jgi:hypothetical protein
MNGVSVANFTHNPWELVDSSVWNSRAWTFQESLFSSCRIFFTAEQVIFNCSYGWNCESIEPIQPLNDPDNHRIKWFKHHEPPIFNNSKGVIHYLIRQYSHRRLSFSKDVLHAFSGVLHAYENLNSPVKHLWGIPIVADENRVLETLYLGLSWEFSKIKAGSCPSRRKDFPSWSWTGWEHTVQYRDWYLARKEYLPPPELEIDIEITSGATMSWMGVKQAVMKSEHYLSQTLFIRVKAWTTTVRLRSLSDLTWEYATIGPEGHTYTFRAQVPIFQDSAELKHMERHEDAYICTGILLGGFKKSGKKNDFHMEHPLLLVVKREQF